MRRTGGAAWSRTEGGVEILRPDSSCCPKVHRRHAEGVAGPRGAGALSVSFTSTRLPPTRQTPFPAAAHIGEVVHRFVLPHHREAALHRSYVGGRRRVTEPQPVAGSR